MENWQWVNRVYDGVCLLTDFLRYCTLAIVQLLRFTLNAGTEASQLVPWTDNSEVCSCLRWLLNAQWLFTVVSVQSGQFIRTSFYTYEVWQKTPQFFQQQACELLERVNMETYSCETHETCYYSFNSRNERDVLWHQRCVPHIGVANCSATLVLVSRLVERFQLHCKLHDNWNH